MNTWLLTIYCCVVAATALFLFVRTTYVLLFTPILKPTNQQPTDCIDVLVPARNEADRDIERHIDTFVTQSCEKLHVIVTNDRSTDATGVILAQIGAKHPNRLTVIEGAEKPLDWLGKTFALEQAKRVSTAPWLALTDADVFCSPLLVSSAVSYAEEAKLDALCVLPEFEYKTFWIGVTLPAMIWLTVMRVSPTQTNRKSSRYAFGFGNFILIRRSVHDDIGGFLAYKSSILDDCEIFERLKSCGANIRIVHGPSLLQSPMYDSLPELWKGFCKNSFAALRYSWLRLFALIFALIAVAVQPFVAHSSPIPLLGTLTIAFVFLTGVVSGIGIRAPLQYYFLFPLGLAVSVAIITRSALAVFAESGTSWKGRYVK